MSTRRSTPQAWWCICYTRNEPWEKSCSTCGRKHHERHAQVHASERAVVYYNPATGEHKTPARADQNVPEVYVRQGFERREILNMSAWEKESGTVHEATTFNPGNEEFCNDPVIPKADPKVIHDLLTDMAAANASGEWTGAEKLI